MPDEQLAEDPVCKMKVNPAKAAASADWQGQTYYFCHTGCSRKFLADPGLYVKSSHKAVEDSTHASVHELPANDSKNCCHGHHAPTSAKAVSLQAFYLNESALKYTCPMHPEVVSISAGSCPKCGMALEAAVATGAAETDKHELVDMRKRLIFSATLTIILLLCTMPHMIGLPFSLVPHRQLAGWGFILASPVVLYGAFPVFDKALQSLKGMHLNMFTLIALGVFISYGVSVLGLLIPSFAAMLDPQGMLFFESAASIVTLVLLGQILELKARQQSNKSLEGLFALAPSKAFREKNDGTSEEISVFDVTTADKLRVRPGDKFPADGVILDGAGSADESILSGNSLPVQKNRGDRVYAGSINLDGSFLVKAESLGRDTVFAQVLNLLSSSQRSRSPMQEYADRVSAFFIPAVFLIAALTFALWLLLGGEHGFTHAVRDTISVLVIACPCALGLATPIAVSVAVARASRCGLLVKDARALEELALATDFFLDKTGTLTEGSFVISDIILCSPIDEAELLCLVASLENQSKHPLAQSIVKSAKADGIVIEKAESVQAVPGGGIKGTVNGRALIIGTMNFLKEQNVLISESFKIDPPEGAASTLIYLAIDAKFAGVIVLSDKLKSESKSFIEGLRALNLTPHILSGDGASSVEGAGKVLQIPGSDLHFNLLPPDKVKCIETYRQQGKVVAMLGDGVNDVAALQAANSGIAMASGSDMALSSAPITLVQNDLLSILSGIRLARLMTAKMKENLFLAFAYNVVALVLATGILYKFTGLELDPSVAAAAMSLSSVSVILNSMKINAAKL